MRKRIGSRIALISALTMLVVEALSPVAAIAAEETAAESEYVETASEEAYTEDAAVEAEIEEALSSDAEDVDLSGVEEAVDDEEAVELTGVEETAEETEIAEDTLEEDVAGDPEVTARGSIDLAGSVYVDEGDPGSLTVSNEHKEKEDRDPLDYKVINVLADGEYHVYNEPGTNGLKNVYINVDKNVKAKFSFSSVELNNEDLAYQLDKEGVSLIEAQAGSVVTIVPSENPNDESDVEVMGGGFINQAGKNSKINIELKKDEKDGVLYVEHGQANIMHTLIATEGTVNMNSGELRTNYGYSAIDVNSGTLNVNGGDLDINGCEGPSVSAKGGTVNVKKGSKFTITEAENDGVKAENVNITGGDTYIQNVAGYPLEDVEVYYASGTENGEKNTIVKKDNVTTEKVNVDLGSHKGINVGEKAKTIKFADKSADITVPASGSLKITGGTIRVSNLYLGIKFNSADKKTVLKPTDAGVFIIGAPDDAISSGKDVEISGGRLELFATDRAITAGENVKITGKADVQIGNCYEGIEGKSIVIGEESDTTVSPNILIGGFEVTGESKPERETYCLDEGICASSKTLVYTYDSLAAYKEDSGKGYTKESTATKEGNTLTTYSGNVNIYIDSEGVNGPYKCDYLEEEASSPTGRRETLEATIYPTGDAVGCEGIYDNHGGFIRVFGDSGEKYIPFAATDDFIFRNGPTMFGAGNDYEGKSEPTNGAGVYLVWGGKGVKKLDPKVEDQGLGAEEFSFKAGDAFKVTEKATGKVIYEDTLAYRGTFIIFGSPMLKVDEEYDVKVGDNDPKTLKGKRQSETDPGEEEEEEPEKKDDPVPVPSDMETANVLGYTVSWNKTVSFNGAKIETTNSSLKVVFAGAEVGQSISNNTILFSKIRYKNNKNAAGVSANKAPQMMLQFKLNKLNPQDKEYAKMSKQEFKAFKKAKKEEVKALNKYFKSNPIKFTIVPRIISASEIPVEYNKSTYKTKNKKLKLNFKVDTKASKPNGKGTVKPFKVKAEKKGKGDFKVVKFDEKTGIATIEGINNFTGTTQVKVTIK